MTSPLGPSVSVVICTHNSERWDLLSAAVESAVAERPDEVIVVVDHNSELLRRSNSLRPSPCSTTRMRVVANRHSRGLSGARNTGIAASDSTFVAFLDDDAEPVVGWLANLLAPFSDRSVVAVGGRALAARPERFPAWWPHEYDWIVGCSWTGLPESLTEVRNVIGCTMAFRRDALAETGGFHADLGRVGNNAAGCEETELCIRLRRRGGRIVYEPQAIVRHHVDDARLTARYFLRRCWAEGRSKAFIRRHLDSDALGPERRFAIDTLRRSAAVGGRALATRSWPTAGRAAAMVGGLGVTAIAFASPTRRRPRIGSDRAHQQEQPRIDCSDKVREAS